MRKLYALFAANKGRGSPMAAERSGNDVTIEVYDVIVSSEADAQWFGGTPADAFCREMRKVAVGDTVRIRVNSPGGDVFAGVAMAQAIRECAGTVVVHVDGYAASAASLLVAAASESVIAPAAMVMIHKAWTIALGNADDFRSSASLLDKIDGEIANSYMARAGGTQAEWLTAMTEETWYTGAEAVAAGLVTRLADGAAKARNSFDLGVYDKAPPTEAPDIADTTVTVTVTIEDAENEGQDAGETAEPTTPDTTASADDDAVMAQADIERRRRNARLSLATSA